MLRLWYLPVMIVAATAACTPRVAPQYDSQAESMRGGSDYEAPAVAPAPAPEPPVEE